MSADAEEQADELLALQSILGPEEFVRDRDKFSGEIRVSPEVPAGFTVALREGETPTHFEISYLPPVCLTFDLPESYPSSAPPVFSLSCSWLTPPQLAALEAQLLRLHQSSGGAVVLFSWVQFLREDALRALEVGSSLKILADETDSDKDVAEERAECSGLNVPEGQEEGQPTKGAEASATEVLPSGGLLTPAQSLLTQLLAYDDARKEKVFCSTVFDCGVCLVSYLGSECVRMVGCEHVFCRGCLGHFCRVQISEGNVSGITCPQGDCEGSPTQAQVKSLVGEELFARYDRLLLQFTLDCMSDVVYCPRPSCASAVIQEASSQMALCSVCGFAFCVACNKTYHGAEACRAGGGANEYGPSELPKTQDGLRALWDEYSRADKEHQHVLEQRYGLANLRSTVEALSCDWMAGNSKRCPHCLSKTQKDSGCNAMTCSRCRRKFCWACQKKIPAESPYQHFRTGYCSLYGFGPSTNYRARRK